MSSNHTPPPPRALQQMKMRLKGAQKGHSLLKRKADALTLRFRQILSKIIEVALVFFSSESKGKAKLEVEKKQRACMSNVL